MVQVKLTVPVKAFDIMNRARDLVANAGDLSKRGEVLTDIECFCE